eukprot:SAG22_NODE_4077_length_1394_cov_1.393822_1_plen_187_part_01
MHIPPQQLVANATARKQQHRPANESMHAAADAALHAGPTPTPPGTLEAVFAQYDLNHDGVLDQREIGRLCDSLGYEVDAQYVAGLVQIFGKYDQDGSGAIEIGEFPGLWAQLGQDPLPSAGAVELRRGGPPSGPASGPPPGPPPGPPQAPAAPAAPHAPPGTLEAVFAQYDLNHDGVLDQREIGRLC